MYYYKRHWGLSLALALSGAAGSSGAQEALRYPDRSVRVVVPFPAGGPTDLLARVVGQKLGERLGQTFIVDNKPGANTIIGADAVAKAVPDGYTLLMAIDSTLSMNQYLYSKLPYDPAKDFEPIGKMAVSPLLLYSSNSGPQSVRALAAQVRSDPAKVSYGYGTITSQLAGELLKDALGKAMVGVPYKGSSQVTQGLLSNDVTFTVDGVTAALPHVQKGTFRALAKLSNRTIPALPDVQPLSHAGVKLPEIEVWMALLAPRGTPPAIVARLNSELVDVLKAGDVREKLIAAGLLPDGSSPEALRALIASEAAKWKPVIEASGIKVD